MEAWRRTSGVKLRRPQNLTRRPPLRGGRNQGEEREKTFANLNSRAWKRRASRLFSQGTFH